jgi:predicted NAD/FAD-binding protein
MNILQHIRSPRTFSVTLNDSGLIDPGKVISRHRYSHPVFTTERSALQAEHPRMIRANRTSFCGAWWANGFHEDGVRSALAVCQRFGVSSIAETGAGRSGMSAAVSSSTAEATVASAGSTPEYA